jgi:peroxiredoxin Q/BCP
MELAMDYLWVAIGLALVFGLAAFWYSRAGGTGVKTGELAPPFSLAGSDGRTHTLAELRGRAVVVAWFPKAFTGGCTTECKSLRESGDRIRPFDAAYFAASVDDTETNRRFAESLGADFPILSDPSKAAARAYGVLGPLGVARRWTFYIGPDGRVLDVDKEIATGTAGSDVAQRLERLGVARK